MLKSRVVHIQLGRLFTFATRRNHSNICIVGSGPAGFYTAQQLVKVIPNACVDIYESLPVPFGLVRYGVAPDHPEVKNVINTFTKIAHNPAVRFVGNVSIGKSVTLEELRQAYHAVILTYGAMKDQELGIPGEDLGNVIPARKFVGWYNGIPWDKNLEINLKSERVAILGQGNVALDIARILLTPVDILKTTDITEHALAALAESKIKEILLIGRRGPLQVAFTIKEFREMLSIPNCQVVLNNKDFVGIEEVIATLPRPRKRLTELLYKTVSSNASSKQCDKYFKLVFLRTPKQIVPCKENSQVVGGIELIINRLEGTDLQQQKAVPTDSTETIDCGLVIRSIGYRSVQADPAIPFDDLKGRVKNSKGVIEPGLYSAGWVATGPVGVIVSTMTNAFTVAETIASDILKMNPSDKSKKGFELIGSLLTERGVQFISFSDWEKIDQVEKERGAKLGKPREKILDIAEMISIAKKGS